MTDKVGDMREGTPAGSSQRAHCQRYYTSVYSESGDSSNVIWYSYPLLSAIYILSRPHTIIKLEISTKNQHFEKS